MIELLRKHLGNVSTACAAANLARHTHYDWMRDDPEYKAEVEAIAENAIDFVESKLFELINGVNCSKVVGDELVVYETPPCKTSIIFYLKTKGRKRGYNEHPQPERTAEGERSEIVLPNGTKIVI